MVKFLALLRRGESAPRADIALFDARFAPSLPAKNSAQKAGAQAAGLVLPLAALEAGKSAGDAGQSGFALFCFTAPPSWEKAAGKKTEQEALWQAAKHFAAERACLLVLPCALRDYAAVPPQFWRALSLWLRRAQACGFQGVLLSCSAAPVPAPFIRFLGRFLREAQACGLECGIIGGLQGPDIPRLLPYGPDYLGFDAAEWRGLAEGFLPRMAAAQAETDADLGADKILVRDYIVPMRIGAYSHEKAAPQPVCFNITAEISRQSRAPDRMGDVFSYDIILDAVERLAGMGHYELVETLAERIAAFLLEYPQMRQVMVRVEKLGLAARAVGVEITRSRKAAPKG